MFRFDRIVDQGSAREQFLDAFQAHLTGLEGIQRETQQSGGKHQPLHVKDQGDQAADRQGALLELPASKCKQQQQRDGRDALQ
ncbi:MAG: Uncharacterised protein [Synechococcus sp. MIT S9220]|nr:MAG: Uncharacterised protein [Synechococcus sp. MIT S9220]